MITFHPVNTLALGLRIFDVLGPPLQFIPPEFTVRHENPITGITGPLPSYLDPNGNEVYLFSWFGGYEYRVWGILWEYHSFQVQNYRSTNVDPLPHHNFLID